MSEEMIKFGEEFDTKEFSLIDDGDYEITLESVEPKTASTGRKYLNLKMRIRKDVEQPFGGRVLFTKIWANDNDPVYNHNKINHIIVTQKYTGDAYKTEFKTFDDILQYLHGLHFIVSVETVFNEYANNGQGADENVVKDWSYKPSKVEEKTASEPVDMPVDPAADLPF